MILQSARLSVEMEAPGANWEKDDDNQEVGLEGAILGLGGCRGIKRKLIQFEVAKSGSIEPAQSVPFLRRNQARQNGRKTSQFGPHISPIYHVRMVALQRGALATRLLQVCLLLIPESGFAIWTFVV
ncbi:unnamed protein product [Microthlaspi erraticum]|uniref:Uncharacterized protein n=1 Tax=Microthlaspi erraticum TaxID=1685480 RepID=A0A6D2IMZ4_9BRAS|nr:unnamed protein product [Microthlaspi erraticum]